MSILVPKFLNKTFYKNYLLGFCSFLGLFFYQSIVLAENKCLPVWIAEPRDLPAANSPKTIEVNQLSQPEKYIFNLKGQVHISQPGMVLISDFASINQKQQTAESWGQVQLFNPNIIITATNAKLNQINNTAFLENTQYQFKQNRSHGRAETIYLNQDKNLAKLTQATYTTCPIITQKDKKESVTNKVDWKLDFSRLEINNQTRRIYSHHSLLYFKDVPLFYTPYISFPMDERASGLLFPSWGAHKSLTQTDSELYFFQPLYINLAPHYDATLTFIQMESRGTALEKEFRYLQPNHSAELTLTGLNDQLTQREGLAYINRGGQVQHGDKISQRWRGKLIAKQQWTPRLTSNVLWHQSSDYHFYNDIPVEANLSTASQAKRHINLNYQQGNFRGNINTTSFLRLRKHAAYNYEKRPEINLMYGNKLHNHQNLHYKITGQMTEFDIPFEGHNRPEAKRTVLTPSLSYINYQPFGKLEVNLIANQVNYTMQNNHHNTTGSKYHKISVPQFAIKAGLNFERYMSFGEANIIQTLEPQIQYLYVPYQDQSKIPLFDTGTRSLNFSNIFAFNRFSGSDRIGDTNQISAALTTRFLNQNGSSLAEAGLGQIFYLADRQVQLFGNIPETSKVSDYFVKLGTIVGPVHFSSTRQYSHKNLALTHANNRLRLEFPTHFKLLLSHTISNHNLPGENEDIATGFNWDINDNWSLGSYWNYNFTQNRKVETSHSLRYDSCCWASELSIQETKLNNGLYNYSIQYVFELKGLSSVGTTFKDYLGKKLNF